jgi:Xaa-Pro aminopeptidase
VQDSNGLRIRRDGIARRWADAFHGPVLVASGLPVPIAGTDQFHDFHSHNEHRYLAGTSAPGSVLAFDPREGWSLFLPVASQEERVWVGDGESIEAAREVSGLERVVAAAGLDAWLERRRGEPLALLGNDDLLHDPAGYGLQQWASLEVEVDGRASEALSEIVSEARRAKDAGELALMRAAAGATAAGHRAALRLSRTGMTERQLQVEVEAEFFRNGSARTAYGSIVGGGPNGAVLHFAPTSRPFADGEIILMDAAAEHDGYAADVTRTWPVGPRFAGIQRDLYQLVLGVQERAIAGVRPEKEYRELHLEACEAIAAGLVDLGILRGQPPDLVERDAHALFFVHGLGHMLGLATHDAGGCLAGRPKSDRFGLKWLRADLPLQENYVVTIEPGIYFIRALLEDPERRANYRDAVNWELVDRLASFGGIRIEDDVRVTATGPEVLSAAIPKQISAIEEARREAFANP